ncbi:hypothetical protein M0804_011860 [Polistes exclamans]|nr:hypothetical protein M0804_011860 [Polistes exclamans]
MVKAVRLDDHPQGSNLGPWNDLLNTSTILDFCRHYESPTTHQLSSTISTTNTTITIIFAIALIPNRKTTGEI